MRVCTCARLCRSVSPRATAAPNPRSPVDTPRQPWLPKARQRGWGGTTLWKLLFLPHKNKVGRESWLCQRPRWPRESSLPKSRMRKPSQIWALTEPPANARVHPPPPSGILQPVPREVSNSRGQARDRPEKARPAHGKMKTTFCTRDLGFSVKALTF